VEGVMYDEILKEIIIEKIKDVSEIVIYIIISGCLVGIIYYLWRL